MTPLLNDHKAQTTADLKTTVMTNPMVATMADSITDSITDSIADSIPDSKGDSMAGPFANYSAVIITDSKADKLAIFKLNRYH